MLFLILQELCELTWEFVQVKVQGRSGPFLNWYLGRQNSSIIAHKLGKLDKVETSSSTKFG